MKVKCIKNKCLEREITVGKEYEIEKKANSEVYVIKNDYGFIWGYPIWYFEEVKGTYIYYKKMKL